MKQRNDEEEEGGEGRPDTGGVRRAVLFSFSFSCVDPSRIFILVSVAKVGVVIKMFVVG